jgi:RNA pseudouridylate synthase
VRAGGRAAVTHWELLERYGGRDGAPVASLLACRLETGRTHQIRVHLAAIGHPLLGTRSMAAVSRRKRISSATRTFVDADLEQQVLAAVGLVQPAHRLAHPERGGAPRSRRPRLPSVMAPGCCRSLRLRPYRFQFVGKGHFWLVDFVDCIERCYIQTFPFLFPSFMPLAPFVLLPSVTAIACIVLHLAHDLVSNVEEPRFLEKKSAVCVR